MLALRGRRRGNARAAGDALRPRAPQEFNAAAIVARAVAGEVAVRLEAEGRVAAGEEELFPVTHFWFLSVVGGTLARTGWRPQDCAFRAR